MPGPTPDRPPASETLQRLGFTPFEAANLLQLQRRYERGALGDTLSAQRLEFARWLVQFGSLSEGQIERSPRTDPDDARTLDDHLPTGRSEHPRSGTNAHPPTATAEGYNVRAPSLVNWDEPIPHSGPTALIGIVLMVSRQRTGVAAIVILLSVLSVVGAYASMAAFGS